MTDNNLITVNEFGRFAPEVDTAKFDAPTLSGIISQASKIVSDYLEYTPLAEDIVDEVAKGMVTTEGDLVIFPQKIPVQSVSAIGVTKGTTTINLTITADNLPKYNIDYSKRNIRYPYQEIALQGDLLFTNFYQLKYTHFFTKISYRGGWEANELPSSIQQAVILITKDILSSQNNQMGASEIRQGQVSFKFSDWQTGQSKFVKDAKRLLNPYRR